MIPWVDAVKAIRQAFGLSLADAARVLKDIPQYHFVKEVNDREACSGQISWATGDTSRFEVLK